MDKEEIIQCLKAVITYDKGEGVPIVQYDNQFLLDKEDIETLLDYINQLEINRDEAIKELFILKDMIYKPETREENFEIQRKISSILIELGSGKE